MHTNPVGSWLKENIALGPISNLFSKGLVAMVDGFAGLVGGKAKVHWTTSLGVDIKTVGFAGWEFGLVHETHFGIEGAGEVAPGLSLGLGGFELTETVAG